MKLLKRILSRSFIVAIAILIQLVIYTFVLGWLSERYVYISIPFSVIGILFVIAVINRNMSASYKVPWIIVLLVMPVVGIFLYLLFGNPKFTRKQRKKLLRINDEASKYCIQNEAVMDSLEECDAKGQAKYLLNASGMPLHFKTATKYFISGEAAFEALKQKLNGAKKFIFMEYFIIEEGKMWNEILDIMVAKVREGVEVKVLYDDLGCAGTLKHDYNKFLCSKGIDCVKFNKLTPIISAVHNNRDHRKIAVIDGKEAFTGGFNLSDEYINETSPFGYWKDSAVYLAGEGVRNLTVMFLCQFYAQSNLKPEFDKYLDGNFVASGQGYVLSFGDGPAPLYNDYIGEEAYLNIINQARRYVYITTPYLIVDYHITKALKAAVKRGVDVRIITPHIPDKKLINIMTKSSYEDLVKNGVKIYEFKPGFIHAKTFVSDDAVGIVGTINLDYRSLVHHFECGVWMYKTEAVAEMREDFDNTLAKCIYIDEASARLKWYQKLVASILMVFAPLL